MKYAIFSLNGKQYKAQVGQELLLDAHFDTKEKKIEFDRVLFVKNDSKTQVGSPCVEGAKVTAEIQGRQKGQKIKVLKYKAKSRYRRRIGTRPEYTKIKIESIVTTSK